MPEVTWDTRKSSGEKCVTCECVLTVFTGIHQMVKGSRKKWYCGLHVGEAELNGWQHVKQ